MGEDRSASSLREQPLGELVKELAAQTGTLVRQEIDLAKAEMTEKGRQSAIAGAMFAGATVVAALALLALTVCFIAALATATHTWLAALIVTGIYLLTAGGLAATGRLRLRQVGAPVPEQTIETVKEDVQWAKTRKQSAKE